MLPPTPQREQPVEGPTPPPDAPNAEIEALRREIERLSLLATRDGGILQVLLEHGHHGILVCDATGKMVVQSRSAERIWAGSATGGGVDAWRSYRAFHPDGRPYEPDDWGMAQALRTRAPVPDRELHIQRFDDSFGWVLASSVPMFGANGELVGAIGVFADITALKESESDARRLEAELASRVADLESVARRASLVQQLVARLAASFTVAEVGEVIAGHVREAFDAAASALYLVDPSREHLALQAIGGTVSDRIGDFERIPLALDLPATRAVHTGEPAFLDRAALAEGWPALAALGSRGRPMMGLVTLPLADAEGVTGALVCTFYDPPRLDAVHRDMFLTVASQCAVAIQRARSFEVAKRALEAETRANERLLRQQQRLELLADVTETLWSAWDSREALAGLARAVIPLLADSCRIDELDEEGRVRLLVAYHRDPAQAGLIEKLAQRWPSSRAASDGLTVALRTAQTRWHPDVPDANLVAVAVDEEHLAHLRALDMRSYASVPMVVRGRAVGSISLMTHGERRLDADDVAFAEELARRAAMVLENTRLLEAAEASRARLHDQFMQMPAAISVFTGPDLRFELVNRRTQAMLGRDVLGRPAREALPELAGQGYFELLEGALAGGALARVERHPLAMAWADGSPGETRYFDLIQQPIRDADGVVDGLVSFAFDVTEQVRARQRIEALADEVARSEQRLRALVDATTTIVWTATADGSIAELSPSWLSFTGQTPEQYRDGGFADAIHPDDRARTLAIWREAVAHGGLYAAEYRLRRADGSWAHTLARALPVRDDEGAVLEYMGCNIDITDLRRAEASAREHAETLATVNHLGQVIAAELDTQRVVQAVTDVATNLTGAQFGAFFYNVTEPSGESYMLYTISGVPREAFSQFPMPRNTEVFGPTFAGEGPVRSDDITRDPRYGRNAPYRGMPEGHLPVRSYLAVPVISRAGTVIGGIFLGHGTPAMFDERHEALAMGLAAQAAVAMDNARLYGDAQRLIGALEATNRELDQFAYVTSHDLKAPLRGIGSLAEWIEEDLGERITDDARRKLELLRKRVHRMEGLIQGILDYSRIGRRPGKDEEVHVGRLAAETWDLLSPPQAARLTVADGMPRLVTDRVVLQQVLLNLMGNAVKHAGKPDVHVRLTATDAGDWWELRVTDDGPGIASEFHDRVWGIFQVLEARDTVESTGIGLAVVKKIVERQGGRAWIENPPGGGASFAFQWSKRGERGR